MALLLVTEWDEFRRADWSQLFKLMKYPLVIDGRNALNHEEVSRHGITYRGIGH